MALEVGKRVASEFRYEVIIYWSDEDGAFIAEVPELPGCAADGATYQEVIANVMVVIREWIETARELGRPVAEPKRRSSYAEDLPTTNVSDILA
jgi:predicted RNase H-like HicB family nuclease